MLSARPLCYATPLLLLPFLGCDRSQPLDPVIQMAAGGTPGPTVAAPSGTNAVAVSETRIDVSWQDNATNETGFEVHRSSTGPGGAFALRSTAGANVTSYSDAGLGPLTEHCYKVRAVRTIKAKTSYSEFSPTACATTPAPPVPTAPSGTEARPIGSSAVDVSWIDNSTNEDGFRLERSLDLGSTWTSAGTIGPNGTSLQDFGLTSERQVCYRVIAFNLGGDSPSSNLDCTAPPATPTGLTATAVADQAAVDLTWTDNSAVEDGYQVLRDNTGYGVFSVVADLPANSTSYRDVTASSSTNWYHVMAKKNGGFSDLSNVASAECVHPDCPLSCSGNFDCPGGYVCGPDGFCAPHCNDGVQNGGESDVDCGGDWCDARCADGQTCSVDGDCASGICGPPGICQPPGGLP